MPTTDHTALAQLMNGRLVWVPAGTTTFDNPAEAVRSRPATPYEEKEPLIATALADLKARWPDQSWQRGGDTITAVCGAIRINCTVRLLLGPTRALNGGHVFDAVVYIGGEGPSYSTESSDAVDAVHGALLQVHEFLRPARSILDLTEHSQRLRDFSEGAGFFGPEYTIPDSVFVALDEAVQALGRIPWSPP